jgi:DNA excision repair protein ERCC-2
MNASLPASATDAKPAPDELDSSYRISVRALCEFTGRAGDLDRRFASSPTARQGIAAHQLVARRRSPQHQIEMPLEYRQGPVHVVGRADIFDPEGKELEEIKSCLGPPRSRASAHRSMNRAQLRTYGAMLCRAQGLQRIRLTLTYFDLLSETEHRESEDCDAQALIAELNERCEAFAAWARQEIAHRDSRDRSLSELAWPFGEFRAGQHDLAAAVYRSVRTGSLLRMQAPTGIGKTLGAIYPALRAVAAARTDRIFYLTAKGTGRQNAIAAMRRLIDPPRPSDITTRPSDITIRVLELVAREHACEHPDRECHGDSCPLARGFHDRLPAARQLAVSRRLLDRDMVRSIALEHEICPYHLSTEVLPFADLVVGDCNYWFDRHAMLSSLALEHQWRVTLLIDEAHHLVDRSRAMYSDTLSLLQFIARRGSGLPVDQVIDQFDLLAQALPQGASASSALLDEPPRGLLRALNRLNRRIGLQLEEGASLTPELLQLYFRCLSFTSLAEQFADHSICEVSIDEPYSPLARGAPQSAAENGAARARIRGADSTDIRISLHNVVPAPFIRERIEAAQSIVMFSATLHPEAFDRAMLGWNRAHHSLALASPFDPARLRVRTIPLTTRLDRRKESARSIAALIARQYREAPGCYIAFFSSFDYLAQIEAVLKAEFPELPQRSQQRSMSEAERARFVAGFDPERPSVALAVLGGVFSEGMDLPGDKLIGAFIVTLGMPQVNPLNQAFCARIEQLFGQGFEFTYLYPGICKVIQAAGRVIRDTEDRGTLLLIDERWRQARYRTLLPAHWGLGHLATERGFNDPPPGQDSSL